MKSLVCLLLAVTLLVGPGCATIRQKVNTLDETRPDGTTATSYKYDNLVVVPPFAKMDAERASKFYAGVKPDGSWELGSGDNFKGTMDTSYQAVAIQQFLQNLAVIAPILQTLLPKQQPQTGAVEPTP